MKEKRIKYLGWALVVAAVLTTTIAFINNLYHAHQRNYNVPMSLNIDGAVLGKPKPLVVTMNTAEGKPFTEANLKGRWTLFFFGFTNCGYVCPTTLSALNQFYIRIQAELPPALWPQIVMVTVDPDRDTAARMKTYLHAFNASFIGLLGNSAQTKALANQMSVTYAKVESPDGEDYMMDHSAEILVVNPNGQLSAFFSYPHEATQLRTDYEAILKSVGQMG
jgi:protein SCO1/2